MLGVYKLEGMVRTILCLCLGLWAHVCALTSSLIWCSVGLGSSGTLSNLLSCPSNRILLSVRAAPVHVGRPAVCTCIHMTPLSSFCLRML
jgi:hypothetical protein